MIQHSEPQTPKDEREDKNVPKCPHCELARSVIKQGYRKTQHRGKIQKWCCKDCSRYFTVDQGFFRMRKNPKAITKAIDLYFSNLSSRKVRNHYKRHEECEMSHVTVLDWCRRYAAKVQNHINKIKPQIGGQCYADDTEIPCGGQRHNFWVCIDWSTRYITGTHYSTKSGYKEATQFLDKATKGSLPKYIQTDAAGFYPRAFKKLEWMRRKPKGFIQHRINNTYKTGKHNVRIETVFSKIKDRVDDMRGLKALWSAPLLLAGIILQHNFIERHTTTGARPCELAGIHIPNTKNAWLDLIHEACVT